MANLKTNIIKSAKEYKKFMFLATVYLSVISIIITYFGLFLEPIRSNPVFAILFEIIDSVCTLFFTGAVFIETPFINFPILCLIPYPVLHYGLALAVNSVLGYIFGGIMGILKSI